MIAFGYKITPWEVKGRIDYEKLIKEFGVKKIEEEIKDKIKKLAKGIHPLIQRDFFYAHRDLDLALKEYENGEKFFLYTGRAPSKSSMHIGHLPPFILTKWLQEKFDVNAYIMIPDEEKFWAKKVESYEEVLEKAKIDILNIIALGFDPDKTFVFLDSVFIGKMYKIIIKVARYINFSLAKAVYGFSSDTSIGLIFYPALQIAPTFFGENRCLIPCGIDQDPHFRIQRDLAERFKRKKAAEILSKFVWGLEGPNSKMSASKPETCIFLNGDPDEEARKVFNSFTGGQPTLKEQKEKGGNPDICSVFHWYKILFEPDEKKLKERYIACKSGNITCGECKAELYKKVKEFLKKHQRNLKKAEKNINKFMYDGKLAREIWEKDLRI